MYIAIIRANIPQGMDREQYLAGVKRSSERFRHVPGLIRKNYLYSEQQGKAGGVYFWESREAAEACHRPGTLWYENIMKAYGNDPDILFFECPCVVDNAVGEILSAA